MSRRMTPILLAVALVLGLITYLSERGGSSSGQRAPTTQSTRVLEVDQADILQIRMKRDYWSSFVLKRAADGTWQLSEPASEPAAVTAVNKLLAVLENLPIMAMIDLPAGDSEHHREYGLWEPAMEVTVTTGNGDHTLLFGSQTPDGQGTYCAESGRTKVFVTTAEATRIVGAELAAYRVNAQPAASQPAATPGSRTPTSHVNTSILSEGSGPRAQLGQTVSVQYTGRLEDGTVFDSSVKRGKPYTFTLGASEVIKGWDQGVVGMRRGEKRRLTIPPELGYGQQGRPPAIPPNATLVFDIELLDVVQK